MAQPLPIAVVLSDVHLGDDHGVVSSTPQKGYVAKGPLFVRSAFVRFLEAVDALCAEAKTSGSSSSKIPYLVLAGDFWDVAIRNLSDIARLSRTFFEEIPLGNQFDQILFLPGNHDHQLWTMTQTQTCVIRPLEKAAGRAAPGSGVVEDFPQVVTARIEISSSGHQLVIPGVHPPYGGNVFASGLTNCRPPVNVIYPNLYVTNAETETAVLITHGHFFQTAWRLLSELVGPALAREIPNMSLFYLELLNSPLTTFINFSLAQVGPLSAAIDRIYDEIRDGRYPPELRAILDSLKDLLDRELEYGDEPWLKAKIKELGSDAAIKLVISLLQAVLESAIRKSRNEKAFPTGRHEIGFLANERNLARIDEFLGLSQRDLPNYHLDTLVFGHTHESIPGRLCTFPQGGSVRVWNPGSLVSNSELCDFMPLVISADGRVRAL